MRRTEFVASHPKFAIFESTLKIAMYVASEFSKIQTELALQELRGEVAPPSEAESGISPTNKPESPPSPPS